MFLVVVDMLNELIYENPKVYRLEHRFALNHKNNVHDYTANSNLLNRTFGIRLMSNAIDYFSLGHPLAGLRSHYAWRAREQMFQRFMHTLRPTEQTSILDLGVTPDVSLPESNHFEQRYPWPEQITAVSIEPVEDLAKKFPLTKFLQIKNGPLPFKDQQFDIVFCSAVLEHVGNHEEQALFLSEIFRISRSFFLTTPNRWFPLEFHTITPLIHWLPQPTHQRILKMLGQKFWAETKNLNLLGRRDLERIAKSTNKNISLQIDTVNLFGWPSNLIAWGAHAL